jgi:uncharacterized protein (DUF1015 family)
MIMPSFYCYEISYRINGEDKKTRGFLGAVGLEELGEGKIHPHEMTYSKPKSDRLNILRRCHANTSPIFSLYSNKKRRTSSILEGIVREEPFIELTDEQGFIHRLWPISDSASLIRSGRSWWTKTSSLQMVITGMRQRSNSKKRWKRKGW